MTVDEVARRSWWAVAFESALDGGPLHARVLGEDLVIARVGGELLAAPDRCPHRGASLSGGDVVDAPDATACLVCPYHAVHFASDGSAVHLPARPGARLPDRLSLRALPVRARHGIVWASLDRDPVGTIPDWSEFDVDGRARFQLGPHPWAVQASRITENFNDLAHFATVHAATFASADDTVVPPIDLRSVDGRIEHGVRMHQLDRVTLDSPEVSAEVGYRYTHVMPFASELVITYAPDRVEWIQFAVTPTSTLDPTSTDPPASMVFQQNARDFDLDGDVGAWSDFQAEVNEEDRRVLETVRPVRIGVDGSGVDEVALGFDTFATAYRRRWRSMLGEQPGR
ncbi:Rieske 2Fe-2S domain-containing protein [Ilumatobacter sp.]|uniref:Rieske 2Fe-2S domain-containing protein n=1 Tax=Ilumatobacter sp. TaxID=1967498 RepID=UPI003B529A44